MTYGDAFLIVGAFFLVCIPMLLLFRSSKKGGEIHVDVHME